MKTRSAKAKAVKAVKMAYPIAWERIGGLSAPSKMPGFSIGIPAKFCKTGAKLAKVPGSVCHGCYARKGNYRYDNVIQAQTRRFNAINSPTWVDDMVTVIGAACQSLGENYFRFHDSGDIQSLQHLLAIVEIAKRLPHINFWLPTKEVSLLKNLKHIKVPSNLTIRVGAFKVDSVYNINLPSSAVTTKKTWVKKAPLPLTGSVLCRAPSQNGECGLCRLCWNSEVKTVCYPKH